MDLLLQNNPFKDKIVCIDFGRRKVKYKNDIGDVIVDEGFRIMCGHLCELIKIKSFELTQEHYDDLLSKNFTPKEIEQTSINEAALPLARFAKDPDNSWCKSVIKMITSGSKVN